MSGCTKLEEELRDNVTYDDAVAITNVDALLKACYDGMHLPYQDQAGMFALSDHTTDDAAGPTRAGDWDDNGVWRVLHSHQWNADHAYITNTFNNLLTVVYNTTNVLNFKPTAKQEGEARFLRAFVMFDVLDCWNQVPVRDPGESLLNPPKVLTGTAALDFIIAEANKALTQLDPANPAGKANVDACKMLLMKCYLNKGVIANRKTPTFAAADMQQVITLADQIISSGKYNFTTGSYFDNFAPTNGSISKENIFTFQRTPGTAYGAGNSVRSRWFMTLHYNQNPSGWNGFVSLSDFYDKFEASDKRRGGDYAGVTDVSGLKVGFLVGQQFNEAGVALKDRTGAPLAFTRDFKLKETGANLEVTGIRVIKYPPDYKSGDNVDNDYVYYRYADVWLMKAEALWRTGQAGQALTMVNQLRAARGATALASLTNDNFCDERGREFYWESNRRTDLIRFGKYLQAYQEKPASTEERLIFPIPNTALAVNPNLKQNPGY